MTSAQLLLLASQAVGKLPSTTILPGDLTLPAPFNRPYFSYVLFEALVRGPTLEIQREQEDGDGGIPNDAEQVDDPFHDGRLQIAEGWRMMNGDDDGTMAEIQRDDETMVFIDDDAAIDFVEQRAAAGSPYHRRALVLHAAYEADYASKKEA